MKRFQNKVAGSRLTLPVAALFATAIWLVAGLVSENKWIPFLLMALSTYLMAEINNRNAIIRIRSRMMSASFLFLTVMGLSMGYGLREAILQLCFVFFYLCIFHTYQRKEAVGFIFSAFVSIGIASLATVQILWFVPLLALLVARPLYAMSAKGLSAVFLGIVTPYWLLLPYAIYKGEIGRLTGHFLPLADVHSFFDYSTVTVGLLTEYVLSACLLLTGWIHFLRTAYKDKIRTRMFLNAFVAVSFTLMSFIVIAPVHAHSLMPVMVTAVCPLAAHFFSLTDTRLSNYTFVATMLIVVIISVIGVTTDWLNHPLGLDKIKIVIE